MGPIVRNFFLFLALSVPQLLPAQQTEHKAKADSALSKLERLLYTINPEKGDLIPVYFVQLDDLNLRIDTLNNSLTNIDPGDHILHHRLAKARAYFDSIRPIILTKMEKIELVLYEEALKARNSGDTARATSLFIKSLQHNPSYAPAAYELIKLNLTPGTSDLAVQYYESYGVPIDSGSNAYYYNLIRNLAPQVLDNIIASSGRLISQGLPSDALNTLKDADHFNALHHPVSGDEKIKKAYIEAHKGMYNSLITIAERAYGAKKWDLANYYYEQARQYQLSNSAFLPDNLASQQGIEKTLAASEKHFLLDKKPHKPKRTGRKRRTVAYHRHYIPKARKAKSLPVVSPPQDTLVSFYVMLADSSLNHKLYLSSLRWCDSAAAINQIKHSLDEKAIEDRYAKAARIIILDTVHSAYFLAWKNELDEALGTLSMAKKYQHRYYLQNDTEVNTALTELENRIVDRQCFTARSDYEASVYRALSQFIRSNFLEGRDFLVKARLVYNNNRACGFSDSLLRNTEQQYQGLIRWQEHWNEAKQAYSVKNYALFCAEYEAAYTVFLDEKLNNKGLNLHPLVQYIDDQKDVDAGREIAFVYLRTDKLDEAWQLMVMLKSNGIKPGNIEALMNETGKYLALKDLTQHDFTWLNKIKSSGSWFKKVKKSYFRTLKTQSSK